MSSKLFVRGLGPAGPIGPRGFQGSIGLSGGAGSAGPQGFQGFQGEANIGGTGIFDNLDIAQDVFIGGKLTVDGLIDPTGLVLDGQADVPQGSTGTNKGVLWVKSGASTELMFTNDAGTETSLSGGGGETTDIIFDTSEPNGIRIGTDTGSATSNQATAIAIGEGASCTSASSVAIGDGANTSHASSVAIGIGCVSGGSHAVAIGNNAAAAVDNISIGRNAGSSYSNAMDNVAIGRNSLTSINASSADYNVGIGYRALSAVTSGDRNIAIGGDAGRLISNGGSNVCVGWEAGDILTNGQDNVILGRSADMTAGNVFGGVCIGRDAVGSNYGVALGQGAISNASNQFVVALNKTNKLRTTFSESTVSGVNVLNVEINGSNKVIPLEVSGVGGTGAFDNLEVNGDAYITGKLTVDGLIDPTGLVLDAQSDAPPGSTGPNKGVLWVNSSSSNLIFTNDQGSDVCVSTVVQSDKTTTITSVNQTDTVVTFPTPFSLIPRISLGFVEVDNLENFKPNPIIVSPSTTGFTASVPCLDKLTDKIEVEVDNTVNSGLYNVLKLVRDYPAIAYSQLPTGGGQFSLYFVRANDRDGCSWPSGTQVESAGGASHISMAIINRKPAISYQGGSTDLKYVIADDEYGDSWGSPVNVETTGDVGYYSSLLEIEGRPAIAHGDLTNDGTRELKYIRASDSTGSTWPGSSTVVDSTADVGYSIDMAIVEGRPAITYQDNTNFYLKYIRASDTTGTTWPAPGAGNIIDTSINLTTKSSLKVVNGRPAIAYFDNANNQIKYIRADDSTGSSWPTPGASNIIATVGGTQNPTPDLAIINGRPAISFMDDSGNRPIKYIRALDANGDTWGTAVEVDSNTSFFVGQRRTSLLELNGHPAISYYAQSGTWNLYFRKFEAAEYQLDWIATV